MTWAWQHCLFCSESHTVIWNNVSLDHWWWDQQTKELQVHGSFHQDHEDGTQLTPCHVTSNAVGSSFQYFSTSTDRSALYDGTAKQIHVNQLHLMMWHGDICYTLVRILQHVCMIPPISTCQISPETNVSMVQNSPKSPKHASQAKWPNIQLDSVNRKYVTDM